MIYDFQDDLRNGMTLQEALVKHGLSFKEAVIRCHGVRRNGGKYRNIYLTKGKFRVEKRVNGETIYGGYFEDLDEAVKVRDKLEDNNWDKRCLE